MMVMGTIVLALILIGRFTSWLEPIRPQLDVVAAPFYYVADIPSQISNWFSDKARSKASLLEENRQQSEQLLILQGKLQQLATLTSENLRLRQLLNSSYMLQDKVLVGELIGILPDPNVHMVVANKGTNHGVYVGQPLLDDKGLMGQVVAVTSNTSQVLLITDSTHAIPVQINRNGARSVVEGVGDLHELRLRHVSGTMDIQTGDELVSSGLGQRFPIGYPVAYVESIEYDPGEPFATVKVRPAADLNRSRNVLFVFSEFSDDAPEPLLPPRAPLAPIDPESE